MSPTAGAARPTRRSRRPLDRPPSLATGPAADVLRRLELTVTRRLDGMLQGDYRGPRPRPRLRAGRDPAVPAGDDVRRIDWNVTARMQTPHVRETIADRELETWVLADLSASLDFGTADVREARPRRRRHRRRRLPHPRTGNRVGAIVARRPSVTRPSRPARVASTSRRCSTASSPRPRPTTRAHPTSPTPSAACSGTMQRRGLAVVISDFLGPRRLAAAAARRSAARHEVLAVEVVDPRELELPDVGRHRGLRPRDRRRPRGQHRQRPVRERLRREAAGASATASPAHIRAAGADHLVLRTDSDWLLDLVRFVVLAPRAHRRTARGSRPMNDAPAPTSTCRSRPDELPLP